jgi:hypothetical protein
MSGYIFSSYIMSLKAGGQHFNTILQSEVSWTAGEEHTPNSWQVWASCVIKLPDNCCAEGRNNLFINGSVYTPSMNTFWKFNSGGTVCIYKGHTYNDTGTARMPCNRCVLHYGLSSVKVKNKIKLHFSSLFGYSRVVTQNCNVKCT